jgi:hypothetical protein
MFLQICLYAMQVDVTNLGLDEFRNYPELVTSVVWSSIHVLMDMLLFLIVSPTSQSQCRCKYAHSYLVPSCRSSISTRLIMIPFLCFQIEHIFNESIEKSDCRETRVQRQT